MLRGNRKELMAGKGIALDTFQMLIKASRTVFPKMRSIKRIVWKIGRDHAMEMGILRLRIRVMVLRMTTGVSAR